MEATIRTCCLWHKPALLELAGRTADAKEAGAAVLCTVGDEGFWTKIQKYVSIAIQYIIKIDSPNSSYIEGYRLSWNP
jgi:hypothetical protein